MVDHSAFSRPRVAGLFALQGRTLLRLAIGGAGMMALVIGCSPSERPAAPAGESRSEATVREIPSPAGPQSAEPNLTTLPNGTVLMSWLEKSPDREEAALRFARAEGERWGEPVTVTTRADLFVNWADFPSVVATASGTLFAHWLQKSGEGPYAYDVRVATSGDGGSTWSDSKILHEDRTKTEHGFVSMVRLDDETVAAIWLDGREMAEQEDGGHSGSMQLRYATIDAEGAIRDQAVLDDRVCECCQTSMARTGNGLIAVYRDRSENEIRDIGVVRLAGGQWSSPRILRQDGWRIEGCPVNGPQIDARGKRVTVAWFTAGGGEAAVYEMHSDDGGETWSEPVRVDEGRPVGRVDIVMLEDGSAMVAWIEQGDRGAEVLVRRIASDGTRGETVRVGDSATARSAGFPRMATAADQRVHVAWTEPGDPARIRTAVLEWNDR